MYKAYKIVAVAFGTLGFLVLLSLFIPGYLPVRIAANQTSALKSIAKINQAEKQYDSVHRDQGFTCSLSSLESSALPTDISSGSKAGYVFSLEGCGFDVGNRPAHSSRYKLTAVPLSLGRTGKKGYCSYESGRITVDLTGGTNCNTPVE